MLWTFLVLWKKKRVFQAEYGWNILWEEIQNHGLHSIPLLKTVNAGEKATGLVVALMYLRAVRSSLAGWLGALHVNDKY